MICFNKKGYEMICCIVIKDHRTVIEDHPDDWVVDDEVDIEDPPENI